MENKYIYKIIVHDIFESAKIRNVLYNLGLEWDWNTFSIQSYNLPIKIFAITMDGFRFSNFPITCNGSFGLDEVEEINLNKLQQEEFRTQLNKIRILASLEDEDNGYKNR